MNGGLPTGSLIPPNADPADMQFYQSERYSTERRVAVANEPVPSTPITIPYVFSFLPEDMRTQSIRQSVRERLILVAKSYPDKALQIVGLSFKATSNFWAPVAINISLSTNNGGKDATNERVLNKSTVFDDRMVTAVIPPNGDADVDVFFIRNSNHIVPPLATRAQCESGSGIKGMLSVNYPDYDAKIMGAQCRKVLRNTHLGIYVTEIAAGEPNAEERAKFLSKRCAQINDQYYAMYSGAFQEMFEAMLARERNRLYLDDAVNEVHDFVITVMPQVSPRGAEPTSIEDIASKNPLIAVSLINPSQPNEEVGDRWNNRYMVTLDCVFYFAPHKRK